MRGARVPAAWWSPTRGATVHDLATSPPATPVRRPTRGGGPPPAPSRPTTPDVDLAARWDTLAAEVAEGLGDPARRCATEQRVRELAAAHGIEVPDGAAWPVVARCFATVHATALRTAGSLARRAT